jgi:hypothetical protein
LCKGDAEEKERKEKDEEKEKDNPQEKDVPQPAYRYCSTCLERVQFDEAGRLFFWLLFHNFCRTEKPSTYLFFRDVLAWLKVAGATEQDWLVLNTTQRAGREIVGVTTWEGRWSSERGLNEVVETGTGTGGGSESTSLQTSVAGDGGMTETFMVATKTGTGSANLGGAGQASFSSRVAPLMPLLTQMPGRGKWPYTRYGVARRRGETARWTLMAPVSGAGAAAVEADGPSAASTSIAATGTRTAARRRPTAVIEASLQWYPRPLGPRRKAHASPGMEFPGVNTRMMNPAAWSPVPKATSKPRSGSAKMTHTAGATVSGDGKSGSVNKEKAGSETGSRAVTAESTVLDKESQTQTQTPTVTSIEPQPQTTTMGIAPPETESVEEEEVSALPTESVAKESVSAPSTEPDYPTTVSPDIPRRTSRSKTWPINPNIGPVHAETM